eukprot:scaffold132842_cov15-Prasinocladus_malaysianus.AAC.1
MHGVVFIRVKCHEGALHQARQGCLETFLLELMDVLQRLTAGSSSNEFLKEVCLEKDSETN